MTPSLEPRQDPFWSYEDLALFIGAVLPCLAAALVLTRPVHFPNDGVRTVVFQSLFYGLLMGALSLLITKRYGQRFWRSLGWNFTFPGVWLLVGPPLALALAVLGAVLRAPGEPVVQDLITDRLSLVVVLLFATFIGPIVEELTFRGFLLPLLARSFGVWPGILLSATAFGLLHGPNFHWSWRGIVVIGVAGVVFGYARIRTGSTAACALIHIGYNATLFIGFLVQRAI